MDVVKGFGSGGAKGVVGLAGLPGDVRSLVDVSPYLVLDQLEQRGWVRKGTRQRAYDLLGEHGASNILSAPLVKRQAQRLVDAGLSVGVHDRAKRARMAGALTEAGLGALSSFTPMGRLEHAPTSQEILDAGTALTGLELYKPKTRWGRGAEAIGENLPAAVMPVGGAATRAASVGVRAARVLAPAVAGQVAFEATRGTGLEDYARIAAGMAGGVGMERVVQTGARTFGGAAKLAEKDIPHVLRAYEQAGEQGIHLSAEEAIHAAGHDAPQLRQLQARAAQTREGQRAAELAAIRRPKDVHGAVNALAADIAPKLPPAVLQDRARRAAQAALSSRKPLPPKAVRALQRMAGAEDDAMQARTLFLADESASRQVARALHEADPEVMGHLTRRYLEDSLRDVPYATRSAGATAPLYSRLALPARQRKILAALSGVPAESLHPQARKLLGLIETTSRRPPIAAARRFGAFDDALQGLGSRTMNQNRLHPRNAKSLERALREGVKAADPAWLRDELWKATQEELRKAPAEWNRRIDRPVRRGG